MKKSVLAAGLLVAVATLTACGQSTVSGSGAPAGGSGGTGRTASTGDSAPAGKTAAAFADSAAASIKAGTAKMSSTTAADDGSQTMPVVSGEGQIDFANHRSTFQVNMPSAPSQGGGAGKIVYVMDGTTEYMQMSPGGGPAQWIKVDLSKLTGQNTAIDYGNFLTMMNGVSDSSEVGSEDVRGTATTHYKVTVDPKKVLDRSPELKQFYEGLAKLAPGAAADGLAPMPYDIWIDKAGLIERVQLTTKSSAQGKTVSSKMTVEFYDYGQPVDIKIPSPDEVKGG